MKVPITDVRYQCFSKLGKLTKKKKRLFMSWITYFWDKRIEIYKWSLQLRYLFDTFFNIKEHFATTTIWYLNKWKRDRVSEKPQNLLNSFSYSYRLFKTVLKNRGILNLMGNSGCSRRNLLNFKNILFVFFLT